jgi:hypothetical protein
VLPLRSANVMVDGLEVMELTTAVPWHETAMSIISPADVLVSVTLPTVPVNSPVTEPSAAIGIWSQTQVNPLINGREPISIRSSLNIAPGCTTAPKEAVGITPLGG